MKGTSLHLMTHPDTAVATVQRIEVLTWRNSGRWHFRFLVEGTGNLILPDPRPPARADNLWRATCFEAFVATGDRSYVEFNFSPSSEWAAYRFTGPRQGTEPAPAEVDVWLDLGEDWFAVEAAVRCADLHSGTALGLSAIIEEQGGAKSYWALAHPAGPPDFHTRDCFVARLP